jgi:hypothetical protein
MSVVVRRCPSVYITMSIQHSTALQAFFYSFLSHFTSTYLETEYYTYHIH